MIKRRIADRFLDQARPTVLGRIKIGGRSEQERTAKSGRTYRPPVKYDHFLITTSQKTEAGFLRDDDLMKEYEIDCECGPKTGGPREIEVYLVSNDIDANLETSFGLWHGSTPLCTGNGEEAERVETLLKLHGPEDKPGPMVPPEQQAAIRKAMAERRFGERVAIKCPPETCRYFQEADPNKPRCHVQGTLLVQLRKRLRFGGFYAFRTGSLAMIRSIHNTMERVADMTNGRLAGIPLMLRMFQKTDLVPQPNGQEAMITNWKVGLFFEPKPGMSVEESLAYEGKRMRELGAAMILPAPKALHEVHEEVIAETDFDSEAQVEGFHGEVLELSPVKAEAEAKVEPKPEAKPPAEEPAAAEPDQATIPF